MLSQETKPERSRRLGWLLTPVLPHYLGRRVLSLTEHHMVMFMVSLGDPASKMKRLGIDICEFKANLVYIVSFRVVTDTKRSSFLKKMEKTKKGKKKIKGRLGIYFSGRVCLGSTLQTVSLTQKKKEPKS